MRVLIKHKDTKTRRIQRFLRRIGRNASQNLVLCVFASLCLKAVAAPAPRALPAETEAKIRALLDGSELQAGRVGVLISALGTVASPQVFPAVPYDDKVQPQLFAVDADKRFTPASNMKLFTSAMALKVLGPEKTFATTVRYRDATKGSAAGKIELVGGGDPAFNAQGLAVLSDRVRAAGIKGYSAIGADGSLFRAETFGGRYPDGWTLDDTLWYYGPEVGALAYERNQVDFTITGAAAPGASPTISVAPDAGRFFTAQAVQTGGAELAKRSEDDLISVQASGGPNSANGTIAISGAVAPQQKVTLGLAVPQVASWAASAFETGLQNIGIKEVQPMRMKSKPEKPEYGPAREIARYESAPLRELLKRLLKNSDNLYAEMILRDAALESLKPEERTVATNYAARGHELIKSWLKENNVATDALKFTDGSGLSRYDLVTPRAVAGVLSSVENVPGAQAFYDALPIAGVDGTMKNRCKGTAAENNARAKSGTFSIVSCLSGYVTTRDNQRLSVVILTNFVPNGTAARRFQDQVFATLADTKF